MNKTTINSRRSAKSTQTKFKENLTDIYHNQTAEKPKIKKKSQKKPEKKICCIQGTATRKMADFLSEAMENRQQQVNIFKLLKRKEKKIHPRY